MTDEELADIAAGAAATELLRRRRGRRRLLDFTNYTFPQYRAEAAHTLLAEALDRVVSGELGTLMVFAPRSTARASWSRCACPPIGWDAAPTIR